MKVMKKLHFPTELLIKTGQAILLVAATTALMHLIGRDTLGEAGIALIYLVPITWIAYRWGQLPGICAALTAALSFDFFFIPPFNTFVIGRLEGWLVLAIFLAVAILVVERIQASVSQARISEREVMFMYELSSLLAKAHTSEAVAYSVARYIRTSYLPEQVKVTLQPKSEMPGLVVVEPRDNPATEKPDRLLPIINDWGLVGEIHIWQGDVSLPAEDSRVFRNFASQIGQTLERIRLINLEDRPAPANTPGMAL
jgi:K+-sensing histidine kinase KdpD